MNDSLILATVFRLKTDVLVAADVAFPGAPGIQVAMPAEIMIINTERKALFMLCRTAQAFKKGAS